MADQNANAKPVDQKKKGPKVDTFTAALLPETDERLAKISGVSFVMALLMAVWFSTIELVIDDIDFADDVSDDLASVVTMEEKKEEKKEKKKEKAKKPRKKAGGGGKPRGKGNPKAPQTRGVLKLLTSKTNRANFGAYNLMNNEKFAKDIDKVLTKVAGLQTSGKTVLGGRRGRADGSFNEGYAEGGSGGIGDMLGGLLGGGGGSISTKAKGSIKPPSARDMIMDQGSQSRSKSDVMRVVRARTPGLRHIYNKHLKDKPGFAGKVTLKFTISPGGDVISISIVSSSTGYGAFDNAVMNQVKKWKWNKIKSGNTTVTIPFTFSE
jgi:TonB family protein